MIECLKNKQYWIYLSYSNKNIDKVNRDIRNILFGENIGDYCVGEKLVFNGFRKTSTKTYYSSDYIEIEKIDILTETFEYDRKYTKTTELTEEIKFYLLTDNYCNYWYKVFDEENKKKLDKIFKNKFNTWKNEMKKTLWIDYYNFKNTYNADLKHVYCSTIHKAQEAASTMYF